MVIAQKGPNRITTAKRLRRVACATNGGGAAVKNAGGLFFTAVRNQSNTPNKC